MSRPTIEVLYPEIANLHGDPANIDYLAQCRPDARIVRTSLTEAPAFGSEPVDLVYLGPMTEEGQLTAIERLRPYRDQVIARIEAGGAFLFTHNALEVLGSRIRNNEMGYDRPGLDVFELDTRLEIFDRYSGKVMGVLTEVGAEHPVLGFKSQFSRVGAEDELPGFLVADRGIGRNPGTAIEGVRRGMFLGTSLLGPILVNNPAVTRWLLTVIDPDSEPTLAHEGLVWAAYEARLAHFRDPRRWHRFERVRRAG